MLIDELCKQAYKGITAPNGLTNDDKIPYILLRELYREYKHKEIPEEIARKLKDKNTSLLRTTTKRTLIFVVSFVPVHIRTAKR